MTNAFYNLLKTLEKYKKSSAHFRTSFKFLGQVELEVFSLQWIDVHKQVMPPVKEFYDPTK